MKPTRSDFSAGVSGSDRERNRADAFAPAVLSVVLPTYNERDNLPVLLERLETALAGIDWEAIVVDDNSPDGTGELARELAHINPRLRVIRRVGRRGLSGACV